MYIYQVLGGLIVRLKKDNFDSPLMTERPIKKVRPSARGLKLLMLQRPKLLML